MEASRIFAVFFMIIGSSFGLYERECGNGNMLSCVPSEDCVVQCPFGFQRATNMDNTCYLPRTDLINTRTYLDSKDYCKSVGAEPLWIEKAEELAGVLALLTPGQYFFGAEYNEEDAYWMWTANKREIEWNVILRDLPGLAAILTAIRDASVSSCLAINRAAATTTVDVVPCLTPIGYVCKMGEAESQCAKNSKTQCCFSPSYNFYVNNGDSGYLNPLSLRPGACMVKAGNVLKACNDVLAPIRAQLDLTKNLFTVARIGSSYYYISDKATCEPDSTLAIIKDEKVHMFVSVLMATNEIAFSAIRVAIGLTYRLADQKSFWIDGKPLEYYNSGFWFPGEPRRDTDIDGGCAAYVVGVDGNTYRWRHFPQADCATSHRVCEVKIHRQPIGSSLPVRSCGIRKERGVLARSFATRFRTNEASFGEFNWHAAIMFSEKRGGDVKRVFKCSGALIHPTLVLTSAHCIASILNQDYIVVSLGQYDLHDDKRAILDPVVINVHKIIIHERFSVRQNSLNDLALLQLEKEVDFTNMPHIGLACLPTYEEIRNRAGKWECFNTGWNDKGQHSYRPSVLKRIEVNFTSGSFCRSYTKEYYAALAYDNAGYGTYGGYGPKEQYFGSRHPELLCTKSADSECLNDDSSLLICRKKDVYIERPFNTYFEPEINYQDSSYSQTKGYKTKTSDPYSSAHNYQTSQSYGHQSSQYGHGYEEEYDEDYIVNSYGEGRFDDGKWFIIGVRNALSQCSIAYNNLGSHNQYGSQTSYNPYNSYNSYGTNNYGYSTAQNNYGQHNNYGYPSSTYNSYSSPYAYSRNKRSTGQSFAEAYVDSASSLKGEYSAPFPNVLTKPSVIQYQKPVSVNQQPYTPLAQNINQRPYTSGQNYLPVTKPQYLKPVSTGHSKPSNSHPAYAQVPYANPSSNYNPLGAQSNYHRGNDGYTAFTNVLDHVEFIHFIKDKIT